MSAIESIGAHEPRKHYGPGVKTRALELLAQGATYGEVSKRLGVPRDTVKTWKRRGLGSSVNPSTLGSEAEPATAGGAEPVEVPLDGPESESQRLTADTEGDVMLATTGDAWKAAQAQRAEMPEAPCPFCGVTFRAEVPGRHYGFCTSAPEDVKAAVDLATEAPISESREAWALVRELIAEA